MKSLAILLILAVFLEACGSASGAPPLSIPAPAPAKIRVTSPSDDGTVTVTGSADAVPGNNIVRATNLTASGMTPLKLALELFIRSAWAQVTTEVETTAAADGSFSLEIGAAVGDTLRLIFIDPSTNEESDPTDFTVPENSPPIAFSPAAITVDGAGMAYAVGSSGGSGIATVIDLELNSVVSTFDLMTNDPQAIDFDPTNNKLVIADPTNDLVLFVNLIDPSLQTTVAVDGAQSVAVDTTTNRAIVGTTNATNSVVLINLATETIFASGTITNADNPAAAYLGSPAVDAGGGNAVIVSLFDDGSSQITAKDLTVPAFTNFEVIADSSLQGVALFGTNQAIAVDAGNNRLLFADLTGASTVNPLTVGSSPRHVAVDTTDNEALVTNFDDHTVSVIDLSSREVADTVEAGINPEGIVHFSSGNRAAVANTGDNSVTVLP
jgi:YVTN family beta-propeller protein